MSSRHFVQISHYLYQFYLYFFSHFRKDEHSMIISYIRRRAEPDLCENYYELY
jgi:hypothetical protein